MNAVTVTGIYAKVGLVLGAHMLKKKRTCAGILGSEVVFNESMNFKVSADTLEKVYSIFIETCASICASVTVYNNIRLLTKYKYIVCIKVCMRV